MMEFLLILIVFLVVCLVLPWVMCYLDKGGNFFTRYLDWVYDVVNKKEK